MEQRESKKWEAKAALERLPHVRAVRIRVGRDELINATELFRDNYSQFEKCFNAVPDDDACSGDSPLTAGAEAVAGEIRGALIASGAEDVHVHILFDDSPEWFIPLCEVDALSYHGFVPIPKP